MHADQSTTPLLLDLLVEEGGAWEDGGEDELLMGGVEEEENETRCLRFLLVSGLVGLDEAGSAVDAETEVNMDGALLDVAAAEGGNEDEKTADNIAAVTQRVSTKPDLESAHTFNALSGQPPLHRHRRGSGVCCKLNILSRLEEGRRSAGQQAQLIISHNATTLLVSLRKSHRITGSPTGCPIVSDRC